VKRKIAAAVTLTAAAIAAGLYFTSTPDQSTAMTASEADQLALARFNDYQNGVTALDATIPVSGQAFHLTGRVDWHSRLGYATLAAPQPADGTELLQWSANGIAVRGGWTAPLPAAPPSDGWMLRPWQPSADLDTALQLILDLGSDRPENPQLLQQSGATVLGHDTVSGTAVTVFTGPPDAATATPHTRYWIAADGTLRRFEALVDGSTTWTRVDLTPGPAPAIAHIPGMQ
jgi:hypothetical protein